jgi:fengycin family lipopeptide synthetase D
MYVTLVKVDEEEYDLDFSMHHIISDGYSLEVLKNEFYILYNEYKQGKEGILAPLRIQYKDFAAWQNKLLEDKDRVKQAKEYWVKQLSGQLPVLDLPVTYSYSNLNSRNSSGYRIVLSEDIKNKLKELANKYNTSLFVVILSAFKLYLWNLTAQKDILVGTAGLGRNHADLRNVIGYFINTTILRNQIDIEENFEELLQRINANTLKALEYQYYPTELIVDELKIKYPKINVFINMLNMGQSDKAYIEDFQAYHIEKVQDVKFDLVWYITEYANGVEIICNYLLDLFDMMTIEFIMDKFIKLLENILNNTTKPLKELKSKKKRSI